MSVFRKQLYRLLTATLLCVSIVAPTAGAQAAAATPYKLVFRALDPVTDPLDLQHATLDGRNRLIVRPTDNVARAVFRIDDPRRQRKPVKIDTRKPFNHVIDTTDLADGTHRATVVVVMRNGNRRLLDTTFTVDNVADPVAANSPYALIYRTMNPDSRPQTLQAATIKDTIRAAIRPKDNVARAAFRIDDPRMQRPPLSVD